MLSVGLGRRCGPPAQLPAQSHQYLLQFLQYYQFLYHLGSSVVSVKLRHDARFSSGTSDKSPKSIWDGRNKVVKMKQNQCIVHSKIININEKVDVNDTNINDFEVDLTAKVFCSD